MFPFGFRQFPLEGPPAALRFVEFPVRLRQLSNVGVPALDKVQSHSKKDKLRTAVLEVSH